MIPRLLHLLRSLAAAPCTGFLGGMGIGMVAEARHPSQTALLAALVVLDWATAPGAAGMVIGWFIGMAWGDRRVGPGEGRGAANRPEWSEITI